MNLRRLRSRFSIANRPMAIRAHVPWYWRALRTALVLAVSLALAGWIFDLGRSLAGFQRGESEQRQIELETQLADARSELQRLTESAAGNESSLQIEQTARQALAEQVKRLEAENGQLREEFAALESLVSGGRPPATPTVARLSAKPAANGLQIQALLVVPNESVSGDARVQIVVSVIRGDKTDMLSFPSDGAKDADRFQVHLRKLSRFENTVELPAGAKPAAVELRLMVKGAVVAARKVLL